MNDYEDARLRGSGGVRSTYGGTRDAYGVGKDVYGAGLLSAAEDADRLPVAEDDLDEEEEALRQRRRRQRRQMQRQLRARRVRRQKRMALLALLSVVLIFCVGTRMVKSAYAKGRLSKNVQGYRKTVEKYAKQEKISKYLDTLMAIMMVESEGRGEDVMQSSESKGLARNSLGPEESIEQACIYYAALVKYAEDLGVKDEEALIQSYNFGPGYLEYVRENGKKHTEKLAEAYAKERSGGEKMRYLHLYAIKKNGGWIYRFGNMFYVALVEKYM